MILTLCLLCGGAVGTASAETTSAQTAAKTGIPLFDEDHVVLSFGAISDLHVLSDVNNAATQKYATAIRLLKQYAGGHLDAITVAGDISNSYYTDGIGEAFRTVTDEGMGEDANVFFVTGNHDAESEQWDTLRQFYADQSKYLTKDLPSSQHDRGNRHMVIGGYHYIGVNMMAYWGSGSRFDPQDLEWLDRELAAARADAPGKPIFVYTHAPIRGAGYGGYPQVDEAEMYTHLKDYPEVIAFSGHVHSPIHEETAIYQRDFTALDCGAVQYMSIGGGYLQSLGNGNVNESGLVSNGLLVQVDKHNNVKVTRLDFTNGAPIKQPFYKSIRFYDRVLTPEEVANNARADGVTVVDPADKPKTFITVAQPKTNIVGDISMIREVNSKAEMDAMTSAKALPATAIYTVNSKLEALDAEGKAFATVAEILAAHDYKILPAFRVADKATADALVKHLKDIRFYDAMVISADPAVVKDFRTTLPQVTAVIDYTETYKDAADLTEEQLLDIRRSIKMNNGTVALLPAALCRNEDVQYLYNRQVNVWAKASDEPSVTEQYHALLSGAIGVVSDATDALLDIACNKLAKDTVTRATLNIGHRGIPASAPENTVEGSLFAFEQGANVIELDVYLTTDGEVVVMHDGTTGRTCNANLTVESSTLAQLKELYVNKGYENNSKYKNCRIPTLNEYLEAFKDKDCQLFIEIKSGKTAIVKAVKECVDAYDMYDQCSVITFNEGIMAAMRKDYPEMSVGALCGGYMAGLDPEEDFRSAMTFIGKYNATLNPSAGGYEASDLRAALQRGISIYPWTFRGNLDTYKSYFMWGFSGLTGDNANVFRRIVRNVYNPVSSAIVEVGAEVSLELAVTTYGHDTSAEAYKSIMFLAGEDIAEVKDGKLTVKGEGEITYVLTYEGKVSGAMVTYYTQPVTLSTKTEATETEVLCPSVVAQFADDVQ